MSLARIDGLIDAVKASIVRSFDQGPEAEERFVEHYAQQLELLPASKRDQARGALLWVFKRLFSETLERKHVVAELVAEARTRLQWLIANADEEIQGAGQPAQRRMDI